MRMCDDICERAAEIAGLPPDSPARMRALAHAFQCPRCAAALRPLLPLMELLDELPEDAPPPGALDRIAAPVRAALQGHSRRILVIDDDRDLLEILCEVLRGAGFETIAAQNGADALEKLAAVERPALILLDLMMPVMNGWQFRAAQGSQPELASIPVVVMTANHKLEDDPPPAAEILWKPLRREALLALAARYCA
jgi:CheY-like chemotaxis protein